MIRAWAIALLLISLAGTGWLLKVSYENTAVAKAENARLVTLQDEVIKRAEKLQVLNMELQASEAAALVSAQEAKSDVSELAMQNPDFIECFKLHSAVGMRYHQNEL